MPKAKDLTLEQKRQIVLLDAQGAAVRGSQALSVGLGLYGTVFAGRGLSCLVIMATIAAALQTQLPVLPPWLDDIRKRE